MIPIKELNEALEQYSHYDRCKNKHLANIHASTKFTRNLLQAISDGKIAVVLCEATDDIETALENGFQYRSTTKKTYKAAIKASPNVTDGLWEDKT